MHRQLVRLHSFFLGWGVSATHRRKKPSTTFPLCWAVGGKINCLRLRSTSPTPRGRRRTSSKRTALQVSTSRRVPSLRTLLRTPLQTPLRPPLRPPLRSTLLPTLLSTLRPPLLPT